MAFTTLTVRVAPGPRSFTLECLTLISAISEFSRNLIWVKFCLLLDLKVKEQSSGFVFVWEAEFKDAVL